MQIPLIGGACALALSLSASASGPEEPVQTVAVNATRYDQRRDDTASTVVVARAELLRQGDRSLGEALKRVAGITIGSAGDIRLRGLGNGYTRLLLNGVPAPNGFAVESLAPELIERIEIIRTGSVELGAQAIAGIVNVVLRAPSAAASSFKVGVDRRRSSHGASLAGESSGKAGAVTWTVPVSVTRAMAPVASQQLERGPGLHRLTVQEEMNARSALTLSPRVRAVLASGAKLDLALLANAGHSSTEGTAGETVFEGSPTRYPERNADLAASFASLRADLRWTEQFPGGARLEAKAGASRSVRHSDFDFGTIVNGVRNPGIHFVRADQRDAVADGGASLQLAPAGGHQWSFGWDGAVNRRTQTRLGRDFDVPGTPVLRREDAYAGSIKRLGIYLQDQWEIDQAWSVSLGWRYEVMATEVSDVRVATVRQRSGLASPVLQALYKLAPDRQVRLAVARTYKAPALWLLIPRRFVVDNHNSATNPDQEGNRRLRPEKAWGLDAGYDHRLGKDGLLAASVFVRRITDVTVARLFQDGAAWVSTPDNQGGATVKGITLEAKLAASPRISLNANATRNWSRVHQIAGPHNRLEEQLPLSASAGIDYRGAVRAGASLTIASGGHARRSPDWTSLQGGTRSLDLYLVAGNVRLAASNLWARDVASGAIHGADRSVFRTRTGPLFGLTYETGL